MSFSNKNILIVGASSGIGLALLKLLNSQGANTYTLSRSKPSEPSIHFEWDAQNPTNEFLTSIPDQIHGLVYCPGTINLKPANRLQLTDFHNDMQVNLYGLIYILNQITPKLKASGGASILAFSTVATRLGMPFHASVAAAKSAVEGYIKAIAAEMAIQKIRANVIAPSLTDTPLAGNLLSSPEKLEVAAKRHPIQQVGNASEIADLASFLLSDSSKWITGQIISIDGGMSTLKV